MLHHKEGYVIYRIHITYIVLLLNQLGLLDILFSVALRPKAGHGLFIFEIS